MSTWYTITLTIYACIYLLVTIQKRINERTASIVPRSSTFTRKRSGETNLNPWACGSTCIVTVELRLFRNTPALWLRIDYSQRRVCTFVTLPTISKWNVHVHINHNLLTDGNTLYRPRRPFFQSLLPLVSWTHRHPQFQRRYNSLAMKPRVP